MRDQVAQRFVAIKTPDDFRQKGRERDDMQRQRHIGSRRNAVGRNDPRDRQIAKHFLGRVREEAVSRNNGDIGRAAGREQSADRGSDRTACAEEIINNQRYTAADVADELTDLHFPATQPCLVDRRNRKVKDSTVSFRQLRNHG